MRKAVAWMSAVLIVCAALAGTVARAGEPDARARGEVILSWDEFVKITGYDPDKGGAQVVTIPWAEVESLLGVKVERVGEGATVDLPWNEFKALLEWSIRRGEGAAPPADYIVTSWQYMGSLSADLASFTLKVRIEVLKQDGWKRIPLLPANVALTDADLPDGVFLNTSGRVYEALTEKTGPIEMTLKFSVAVRESAGIYSVRVDRVALGSSVLDLTFDRADADVKIADAQSFTSKSAQGKTHVAAAIPSGVPVAISWERALPKVEPAPTKLYAETNTLAAVAEGLLLCQETVSFNILHSPVRELKLRVPADASVIEVTGPSLQDWRVGDDGLLRVVLRNEVIGGYNLRITYERSTAKSTDVPVIRAMDVERERGFVAVVALTNVEIGTGEVEGAAGIDVRQLPPGLIAMTNQPVLLGFRYVGREFTIPLSIKKHGEVSVLVTVLDKALYTTMQLSDGRRMTKVLYSVRNNRNQFLRMQMPQGADIWSVEVSGNTVAPAKDETGNVLIPLVRSSGTASELSSFPVEMVYVETPAQAAPARGTLHVALPKADAPVMHVMYNYYLPAEGKYTLGWGRSAFSGPLRQVDRFTALAAGPGADVIASDALQQAQMMEEQVNVQVEQRARAAGATPIRVRLPINGVLFKLEKILALPGDNLWFEVQYSGWEVAK